MSKEYEVLKIDSLTRPSETGGITKVYRIQYKTQGGVVDSLDISEKDYTEEKVAATLAAAAQKHDKMLKL